VAEVPELVSFPYYRWHHAVIAPPAHPLHEQTLSLETLAEYPIVTYHQGFTGRAQIDRAFADASLTPDIVMAMLQKYQPVGTKSDARALSVLPQPGEKAGDKLRKVLQGK
jgi:DNA-binding transcriptional LysR family regulator